MKKIFTLLVSLMLATGCVADTDEYEYYEDEVTESDNDMSGLPGDGGGHWPACHAVDIIELQTPDGETVIIEIPIMCNPFYIDMGDPPPEKYDPIEKVGNPYDGDDYSSQSPYNPKF